MKTITLTQGKNALVDDKDYELLSLEKWYARKHCNTYYAVRNSSSKNGNRGKISMHREILKPPFGRQTDHRDGDGLNNCRGNLRIATNSQNQANRQKVRGISQYKGVYWDKRRRKWMAGIRVNGKRFHLGCFVSEKAAARAYNAAAWKYFGEFARSNVENGKGF